MAHRIWGRVKISKLTDFLPYASWCRGRLGRAEEDIGVAAVDCGTVRDEQTIECESASENLKRTPRNKLELELQKWCEINEI